ncbi:MAG: immunoglobulin-like domain-containing protein [Treponema sp.]
MKHISRVVAGFSMITVLALFAACKQPAGTSSGGSYTPPAELGVDTTKLAGKFVQSLTNSTGLTVDQTTGMVNIKKDFNASPTIPASGELNGYNYEVENVTSSDKSIEATKDGANWKLTIKKPEVKAGADHKVVTLTITVKGKGADTGKKTVTVTFRNGKDLDAKTYTADSLKALAEKKMPAFKKAVEDAIKANNEQVTAVKSNFTIGAIADAELGGISLTWTVDTTGSITFAGNTATVTRGDADKTVKISVTLTAGSVNSEAAQVLEVTVTKKDTAEEKVREDLGKLKGALESVAADKVITFAKDDTANKVTQNFEFKALTKDTVTVSGLSADFNWTDVVLTWSIQGGNHAALKINGNKATVKRPAHDKADVDFTLQFALASKKYPAVKVDPVDYTNKITVVKQDPPKPTEMTAKALLGMLKQMLSASSGVTGVSVDEKNATLTFESSTSGILTIPQELDATKKIVIEAITVPTGSSVTAELKDVVTGKQWVITTKDAADKTNGDTISNVTVTVKKDGKPFGTPKFTIINKKGVSAGTTEDPKAKAKEELNNLIKSKKEAVLKGLVTGALTSGETAAAVKTNFTIGNLPSTDFTGITAVWSSSNSNVVALTGNNATVKRPASTAEDKDCKTTISVVLSKMVGSKKVDSDAGEIVELTVVKLTPAEEDKIAVAATKKAVEDAKSTISSLVEAKFTGGLSTVTALESSKGANWSDIDLSSYKKNSAELKWVWKLDTSCDSYTDALKLDNISAVALTQKAVDVTGKIYLRPFKGSIANTVDTNDVEIASLTISHSEAELKKVLESVRDAVKAWNGAITFASGETATTVTQAFTFATLSDTAKPTGLTLPQGLTFDNLTLTWSVKAGTVSDGDAAEIKIENNTVTVKRPESSAGDKSGITLQVKVGLKGTSTATDAADYTTKLTVVKES